MDTATSNSSSWLWLLASVALLAIAGWVDYATGPTIIVFPLYLLPVVLSAWFIGRTSGLLMSVAATAIWLGCNLATRDASTEYSIPIWNAFMWLCAFSVVVVLTHARKELGRKVEELVHERTKALQAELAQRRHAEQSIHRLAAQLSDAEESQRRQLAQDIHDTLGQTLTVIKMNLQASLNTNPDERLTRQLQDSLGLIENMIRQTRSMTFELYPAMLDDLGLVPTIRRHLEDYKKRTGIRASLSESGESWKLPAPTANYLYRSVKELINNASKHGRAIEILVTVHWRPDGLRVVVDDDGCGFDLNDIIVPHNGLGLASIEERLLSLGGKSHIESEVGKGTRVILEVPAKTPLEAPSEAVVEESTP